MQILILSKINWIEGIQNAAALIIKKFQCHIDDQKIHLEQKFTAYRTDGISTMR